MEDVQHQQFSHRDFSATLITSRLLLVYDTCTTDWFSYPTYDQCCCIDIPQFEDAFRELCY